MGDWFVRPATRRLQLSDDQWLLVKRRLTAGEYRAHLKRSSQVDEAGLRRLNTLDHGASLVVAYLLDWSLTTDAETIRGLAPGDLASVLDTLDPDHFSEIFQAVDAHVTAMDEERAQAKNGTGGEKRSVATSPSPSAADGVLTGSAP
jgi:hypothetical protein